MTKRAALACAILTLCIFLLTACSVSNPLAPAATATPLPTATATPSPTATPLVNTTYTSTTGVYKIDYPGSWTLVPITTSVTSGSIEFVSSTKTDLFQIAPLTANINGGYTAMFLSYLNSAKVSSPKLTSSTPTTKTLPTGSWSVLTATGAIATIPFTFTQYGIVHDSKTFVVYTWAPTAAVDTEQSIYFGPMLNSLAFLK